jgi:outer membrane protein assembly factor BamE (lipoprotein component of BamABCDE complex)
MKSFSRPVVAFAVAAVITLAGCATGGAGSFSTRNDSDFAQVRQGMTRDEVLRMLGPPTETMQFARTRTDSLDYVFWDSFGYMVRFSVIMDDTGHVTSTVRARLNDGSSHQ